MTFKRIIFWSEFPKKVNWNKIIDELKNSKKIIEVYVAVKSKKEFLYWKKNIDSRYINLGAWPILSKEEGYWFSGFTDKKDIDKLDEFSGVNFKLDIEPPIPRFKYNFFKILFFYFIPYIFKGAKNSKYLSNKVRKVSKGSEIILSGFAFPKFITKRFGDLEAEDRNFKNYICYATIGPRPLMKLYYRIFIKNKVNDKTMFAVGCLDKGILGNEPIYSNISEFKEDIQMLKNLDVKNIVVYSLEGLTKKKDMKNWLKVIFS